VAKKQGFSLFSFNDDSYVSSLNHFILYSVRILAALMVLVVIWSLIDVGYHLFTLLFSGKAELAFDVDTIFSLLGGFLAVLIAIEVYLNIIFYLKKDSVHVPLVLATALTAIARKVIVLDYQDVSVEHLYATAGLVATVGVAYWLVAVKND
jgi:uncharacterized membrane protein (DUF373 family)